MKIVVSSQGENLDAPASPVFGRCPTYVFVDTETMAFEAIPNPAMNQGGGAGIQAAQFVVNQGAQAVLSGNLGPNAFDVLQAAGVAGYLISGGSVRQAVEAYKSGSLTPMAGANVAAHAGMGGGRGRGMGMGMGRGRRSSPAYAPTPTAASTPQADKPEELANLRATLKDLRQQLAETMAQIEKLEKES
jgi:predicted Fe-Mo cluster-binding NifX family protein